MDVVQCMKLFARVADAGGFSAAALSCDSSVPTMSRAVGTLEQRLKIRLMNRSTRRLSLTAAGERYLERCRWIIAAIETAEQEARGAHQTPSGKLKIHSYAAIGQRYVIPAIQAYRRKYEEVSIELACSQQMPELFDGTSDVAIVAVPSLSDCDVVSHKLGSIFSVLCASPEYIARHGIPDCPDDLARHECLTLQMTGLPTNVWQLKGASETVHVDVQSVMKTNLVEMIATAIRRDMGIGTLPMFAAVDGLQDGSLVRVLPEFKLHRTNLYALYASRRFTDAKIKTWIDFFRADLLGAINRDELRLDTEVKHCSEQTGSGDGCSVKKDACADRKDWLEGFQEK